MTESTIQQRKKKTKPQVSSVFYLFLFFFVVKNIHDDVTDYKYLLSTDLGMVLYIV